jgi:XTP/dITP diphosphohydrolase
LGDTIVVATHNAGKLREFSELLAPFGIQAQSAGELGLPEPEETGTTFEENAALKARAAAEASGLVALADDSGLCVDALNGAPGVYTADWATMPDGSRNFSLAMRRVEEAFQARGLVDGKDRRGRFVSVLALAAPGGAVEFFRGEVEGTLVWPPRGSQGFGYDPVFVPEGFEKSFGEMTSEEKHGWRMGGGKPLSHRARAFARFAEARLGARA